MCVMASCVCLVDANVLSLSLTWNVSFHVGFRVSQITCVWNFQSSDTVTSQYGSEAPSESADARSSAALTVKIRDALPT